MSERRCRACDRPLVRRKGETKRGFFYRDHCNRKCSSRTSGERHRELSTRKST